MLRKNRIVLIIFIIMSTVMGSINMATASAEAPLQIGCFKYTVEGDEIIITGYDKRYINTNGNPEIPSFIDGKPIVAIATGALTYFRGHELTIPNTIKWIADDAFGESSRNNLQIYYEGSIEQWEAINKGNNNEVLSGAIINYRDSKVSFSKTEKYDLCGNSVITSSSQRYLIKKNHTLWENPMEIKGLSKKPQKITSNVKEAVEVEADSEVISVADGVYVLKTDGTLWLYYWDFNKNNTQRVYESKKIMTGVKELPQESIGSIYGEFYVIKKNGQLWRVTIKYNSSDTITGFNTKKIASNVHHVYFVSKSEEKKNNIYFVKKDGSLYGWGGNSSGELGIGTTKKKKKPVHIMNDVQKICCSYDYMNDNSDEPSFGTTVLAIKTDGTLWAWGANYHSKVRGVDSKIIKKPVEVMQGVIDVCANQNHFAILRQDNVLWTMGVGTNLTKVDEDVLYMDMELYYLNYIKKNHELWYYRNRGIVYTLGGSTRAMPIKGNRKVLSNVYYVKDGYAVREDGSLWTWMVKSMTSNKVKSRRVNMSGINVPR